MQLTPQTSLMAPARAPSAGAVSVSLVVSPPLTESQKTALAGQPLTVVRQTPDGKVTLSTPAGELVHAVLAPATGAKTATPLPAGQGAQGAPVPAGLAPGAVLALVPSLPAPTGTTGALVPDAAGTALRAVLVAARGAAAAPPVASITQPPANVPVLPLSIPPGVLKTPLSQTVLPVPQMPAGQRVVSPGPLEVDMPASTLPAVSGLAQSGQPLQLVVSAPPRVQGGVWVQAASLQAAPPETPAIPQPGTPAQPVTQPAAQPLPQVPVMLKGLNLPVGTTVPVVVLAPAENAANGANPQPVILQTAAVTVAAPGGARSGAALPETPLPVVITPDKNGGMPPPGQLLARVLPAVAGGAAGTQPILLANGQRGVVQSGGFIPEGSTLVVDIPSLTSAPSVVQVVPLGGHNQPQGLVPGTASVAPLQTAAPVLPVGVVIKGVISGQNAQGQLEMILAEPAPLAGQTVALAVVPGPAEKPPVLTPGTLVQVQVQEDGVATLLSAQMPQVAEKANSLALLGQQWSALERALSVLQQQAPAQAAALQGQLPRVENLLPGLMHMAHAIQTGRVEDFAGAQLAGVLRAVAPDIQTDLNALKPLQQRGETAANGGPTDAATWRGTLFPYVEGPLDKDPKQGRFFWRREQSEDPRGKSPTRFVMELNLSATGPVQLDGLVQYPGIWMKLRRTTPVDPGFSEGLQQLVANLLEAYGMNGGITVEVAPTFPVDPTRDILAASPEILPTKA